MSSAQMSGSNKCVNPSLSRERDTVHRDPEVAIAK